MTNTRRAGGRGRILSALGIADGERRLAGWTSVLFLVTQSTHGLGANAADTLFFNRFGVEELPKMISLAGVVVMVLILGHTVGLTAKGERRWLPIVTGASAAWVFLAWAGVFTDIRVVYPIIWVSTQGIIMLTFTMMWNAAGAICTTRQAKRLFPLFAAAGIMGGILGNLATGPITTIFGTQSLLLAQGSLLALASLLVARIRLLMADDGPAGAEAPPPLSRQLGQALRAVSSNRLLKLAAVFAFVTWILFYMVMFPFSEAVAAGFGTEAEIASFLGIFSSLATGATFVVGLFLAKRLFARIGIVMSLLILPVVYAAGFGLWLAEFSLGTAAAVRGAQWVAVNAIGATAYTALFNVQSGRRRAQVVAFMTAVPAQLGVIAGGLLLVASQATSRSVQFGIGLALALLAVGVAVAMRPAYVEAVVGSVRKGLVRLFDVPSPSLGTPVDAETTRILETHLADERPEARAYAISALAKLRGAGALGSAAGYLDDESPEVRATAFDVLCDWDPEGFRAHAVAALADETPGVRIRALHYAAAIDATDVVTGALGDPDRGVRATAAAIVGGEPGLATAREVLESDDVHSRRMLLRESIRMGGRLDLDLVTLLADEDAEVRALAAKAASDSAVSAEMLRPLLDDSSLRVRQESADTLAGTEEGRRLLLEVLQTGTVNETDAALRALVPFPALNEDLVEWARGEAERAALLDRLGRALPAPEEPGALAFLHRTLESRTERVEQWVLMAMTTLETKNMMPLVQRGVVARDPEIRAQAVEALETVGDRRILSVLLPLLDGGSGTSDFSERRALRELSTDFDPWLRALALRCLADSARSDLDHILGTARDDVSDLVRSIVPSLVPMPVEKSDMLGMMDRVLALQAVPMFADLDPEDLEVLGRSTTEIAYEPAERIYSAGDVGTEALMIVEGTAVVSATRDGRTRIINEYGPGDIVGELALLDSGVRAADVTAGDGGLHGLVMTKSEFTSILEERTSVALGMLSTLAARLAEEV